MQLIVEKAGRVRVKLPGEDVKERGGRKQWTIEDEEETVVGGQVLYLSEQRMGEENA